RLVRLQVEDELAVLDQLGPGAPAGAPEQVLQPRLELAGVERREQEVVEQIVAQVEVAELRARDQQEQRLERDVALAHGPADGERGLGLLVGADDRAGPAVGWLLTVDA